MKITQSRWDEAQKAERKQHTMSYLEGVKHYHRSYVNYFKYLGMDFDLKGKNIIEVGPADFPALAYCLNSGMMLIVEPMPSELLKEFIDESGAALLTIPLEEVKDINPIADEIWLFNVMQHIIDPDKFVEVCKRVAKKIRYFEPINEPVTEYHPHSYLEYEFRNWFGDVNIYFDFVPGFHQAKCVYGTYDNK